MAPAGTCNRIAWVVVVGIALAALPVRAAPLESVTLQLKWKHQFQFAGYYVAQERGYYRDVGLDVHFVEAQPGREPIDAVLGGQAEYGVGTSDLLLYRARGAPVVVLGVVFQHSPLALVTLRESGVFNVHQLAGHKVMIEPHSAELLAYLAREGLPLDKVEQQVHSFDVADLLEGRTDAMSVYRTDEPFSIEQAGRTYSVFSPRAAGVDFYGDNLFTTEAEVKGHPERVRAFRQASFRGWKDAMEHRDEAIDLIRAQYSQRKTREQLQYEAVEMLSLVQPMLVEPGYMHAGRWQHMAQVYQEVGLLKADVPLEGFLYEFRPGLPGWLWWTASSLAVLVLVLAGSAAFVWRANRALAREVARRAATEVALVQARTGAESANRLKSLFLANMSHELRTPLHAITSLAWLGQRESDGAQLREYFEQVHQSSETLAGLVNDILDFSRIEAGRLHVEHVPFDLVRAVDEVRRMVELAAQRKGLALQFVLAPGTPERLVGDPLRFKQVLTNLVTNAVKFTAQGQVTVTGRQIDERDGQVTLEFSVEDTGIGLSAEQKARLFEPFSQADGSTTRRYGGTGLGLAISRQLARLMGGTIGVESDEGRGSVFSFTIVVAADRAGPETETLPSPAPRRVIPNLAGLRVLVVEDNEVNQLLAVRLLEKAGCTPELAGDGRAAVEKVSGAARPWDVVLMDLQMPELDGYEATRAIRALPGLGALRIFAMSAHALADERDRCLKAGMNGHLPKPINVDELYATLEKALRERA